MISLFIRISLGYGAQTGSTDNRTFQEKTKTRIWNGDHPNTHTSLPTNGANWKREWPKLTIQLSTLVPLRFSRSTHRSWEYLSVKIPVSNRRPSMRCWCMQFFQLLRTQSSNSWNASHMCGSTKKTLAFHGTSIHFQLFSTIFNLWVT